MSKPFAGIKKFFGRKEEGATMVEYGLMLALIAAVCVGAAAVLGRDFRHLVRRLAHWL